MKKDRKTNTKAIIETGKRDELFNILKAAFDSSYDGLCLSDSAGNILYTNESVQKTYNLKHRNLAKQSVRNWISGGVIDSSVTLEVIKQKKPVTIIQHSESGTEMLVTGSPIFDQDRKLIYIICNSREITALSQMKEELEETKALSQRYSEELSKLFLNKQKKMNLVVKSKAMKRILEMALSVANFDSTVLISGESGVGKSIIAKLIHKNSIRKAKPFIRVNCGAIPESIVESELFGYDEGAFTGAKQGGKPGYFELANGGTLFLDEIGELSWNVQVKLLHFIEDRNIMRVGGVKTISIDARILAATKRDLKEMIKNNKFREDLFFRLNVVPIHLLPLRERREDVLPLIQHYLEKYNSRYNRKMRISSDALKRLGNYSYPGNVRELSNLIERLSILSKDSIITKPDLPLEILENTQISYAASGFSADPNQSLKTLMEKYEADIIKKVLEKVGTQEKAAQRLKVSQATIARKAKKYDINYQNLIVHNSSV
jgi:PAS domain S-box-containing protein/TyrR family helix-turn-helix protein